MGRGYTPQQVGDMTLDQIFMLMSDSNILRRRNERAVDSGPLEVVSAKDSEGFISGRDIDGKSIKAVIKGESLASRLNREHQEKVEVEAEIAQRNKQREEKMKRQEKRRLKRERRNGI
jgi:hypothetical protein